MRTPKGEAGSFVNQLGEPMHSDDEPVGRVLSRRHALAVLGLAGVGLTVAGAGVAHAATDSATDSASSTGGSGVDCVAKPEMTEGPYFVDEQLNRSDIRTDPADGSVVDGTKLALNLTVLQVNGGKCEALKGATVDIWQCDAAGVYSDIAAEGTTGKKYLRGYQVSNGAGKANFVTILPGWYQGRTVHIHVKIRTTGTDGNPYEFTSQVYFSEEFKAAYLATAPYAAKGTPDTTNDTDMHYANVGDQMLLSPRAQGKGYVADFAIGLDLSDTAVGADDSFQMGGGDGGPGGTPPSGPPPSGAPSPSPSTA
jgi:protocatechuate 3,4-dioxygenase beta subunit